MPIIVNNGPLKASDPDLILWLDEGSGQSNIWIDKSQYKSSANIFDAIFFNGLVTNGTSNNNQTPKSYASGTLNALPVSTNPDYTVSVTFESYGISQTEILYPRDRGQTLFAVPPTVFSTGIILGFFPPDSLITPRGSIIFAPTNAVYSYSPNFMLDFNQKITATVTYKKSESRFRIYINGIEVPATGTGGMNPLNYSVGGNWPSQYYLGSWGVADFLRPLNGKIYNVSMFKRTLTSEEVFNLYTNKPISISTKKTSSDIILYLADRGTSTGWADNSIYSTGARLLGNATFNNGLITSGLATLDGAEGRFDVLPGENFTVSALVCVYGNASTVLGTIIGTSPTSYLGSGVTRGRGFIFGYTNSRQLWFLSDNADGPKTAPNIFSFGETFLATVKVTNPSGTQSVSFYKNGKLISTHENTLSPVTMTYDDPTYRINTWGFPQYTNQLNGKVINLVVYNRPLSDAEINDLYLKMPSSYKSSESSKNFEPLANKILYIDAGEPKSYYLTGTTVKDLTQYNRNGTLTSFGGSGLPTFGRLNGGYFSFKDGSYINFNPAGLPTNGESTIIVWVRISQLISQWQTIFIYGDTGDVASRGIMVTPGGGFAATVDRDRRTSSVDNFIELNKWYQVVQVNKSSNTSLPLLILYINGTLVTSINQSRNTILTKARIGRNDIWPPPGGGTYEFPLFGDVGELTIYDRALDTQEIYQDYKVKRSRYELEEVQRLPSTVTPSPPQVLTVDPTNVTISSAQSGVIIIFGGYSEIVNSGVIWSTNSNLLQPANNPINLTTKTTDGTGLITGLSQNVTYYVVAYAQNAIGIGYGEIKSFTTVGVVNPVVQNVRGLSQLSTQILATASVVSLGNDTSISQRGFVYNTATFSESAAITINTRVSENGSFGLATYSLLISGLNGGTNYWIRAFATNTAGTDYSNDILQIVTLPSPTVVILGVPIIESNQFYVDVRTTGTGRTRQGIVVKTNADPPTDIQFEIDFSFELTGNEVGDLNSEHLATPVAPNTDYYVWGFVQTSDGLTIFTNTYQLVQTPGLAGVPIVEFIEFIESPLGNTMTLNGLLVQSNGSVVQECGFVWDLDTIIDPYFIDLTNNIGFSSTLLLINEGENFIEDIFFNLGSYYIRFYATNAQGTGYSIPVLMTVNGGGVVLPFVTSDSSTEVSLGLWQLRGSLLNLGGYNSINFGFGIRNVTNDSPFEEFFIPQTTGGIDAKIFTAPESGIKWNTDAYQATLSAGTYEWYAFAQTINKPVVKSPGNTRSFVVGASLPTISISSQPFALYETNFQISVSADSLTSASTITNKGFVWSTSTSPLRNLATRTNNGTGLSLFTSTIPSGMITPVQQFLVNTTYYVRGFVVDAVGDGYSNQLTIYTLKPIFVTDPYIDGTVIRYVGGIQSGASSAVVSNRGAIFSTSPITSSVINSGIGLTFVLDLTGTGLSNWDNNVVTAPVAGTTYYIRPFVRLTTTYGGIRVYGVEKSIVYNPAGLRFFVDAGSTLSYPGSGNTWTDITPSGQAFTGTLGAGVTFDSANQGSLVFNNTSTSIVTTNYPGVSGNTERTISVWFNPSITGNYEILGYGNNFTLSMWDLLKLGSNLGVHLFSTGLVAPWVVTNNTWQNFVFKYTTSGTPTIWVYKDGAVQDKMAQPFPPSTGSSGINTGTNSPLVIGDGVYGGVGAGYAKFQGKISIVKIWNKALTDAEILEDYNLYKNRYISATVNTGSAGSILSNSAIISNNSVTSTLTITQRGVVYSTSSPPENGGLSMLSEPAGNGTFNLTLTGLLANTTYYIKAFAVTSNGVTTYGQLVSFATVTNVTVPTVTLGTQTLGSTSITINGSSITSDGNGTITAKGIAWSTSINPDVQLTTKTNEGSGTANFNSTAATLQKGVDYYIRAYATNAAGTGYSIAQGPFKTLIEPTVTTTPFTFSNFGQFTTLDAGTTWRITASASGAVTNTGGTPVTKVGIVYSTSSNPLVGGVNVFDLGSTTNLTSPFLFIMPTLLENTFYFYKAYAQNSVGIGYGAEVQFRTLRRPQLNSNTTNPQSTGSVTLRSNVSSSVFGNIDLYGISYVAGFRYGISTLTEVIADSNYSITKAQQTSPTNNFSINVNISTPGDYLIRTFVRTSLHEHTADFTLNVNGLVDIQTVSLSSATTTSVTVNANLVSTGGFTITQRGVCYSLTPSPTIANQKIINGSTTTGTYTASLTSLTPGVIYYIRAYMTSGTQEFYGQELTHTAGGQLRLHWDAGNLSSYSGTGLSILDLSGQGNGGTMSSTSVVYESSNSGVFRFAGNNINSIISSYRGVTGSTPRTVSMWFNPSRVAISIGGWGSPGSPGKGFEFVQSSQNLGIHLWGTPYVAASFFEVDKWNNLIFTYDGQNIRSYSNGNTTVNGIYSAPTLNTGDAITLRIGADPYSGQSFRGLLSIFKVWDRVISFSEIQSEYNNISPRYNNPGVSTGVTSSLGQNSVDILNNEVYYSGVSPVTDRGVVYSLSTINNPTTANSKIQVGSGTGSYNVTINSLSPGTNYNLRAYATNGSGTSYGKQIQFRTTLPFSVSNFAITNYFYTSQSNSALTGGIKFSFTVTGGTTGMSAKVMFSSISSTTTNITQSPQNIISGLIGIDHTDTVGTPELRTYEAVVTWNSVDYRFGGIVVVAESFAISGTPTYNSLTNTFDGVLQFNRTSGRIVTEIGIAWTNKSINTTASVLNDPTPYTFTPVATNVQLTLSYNFSIPASTFGANQIISMRAYAFMDQYESTYRMYEFNNEKQITKPLTGPQLILNWEGSQYNGWPWTDSSFNGNEGSLRGSGVSYNSSFSPLSIEFTNTSTTPNQGDILATAWNNGPLGTTPFTIAFWILPTDQTNNQGVAAWGTVANNGFFDISIIPASGVFRAVGTTNFASLGDLPVNYNVWQHVVYTFGSQFVDGYIDGTYLTSGLWNGNISSYTNAFRFASGLRSDITRKFNGRLRSISIWRNKLTTDQVVNEYNSNDFIDLEVIRLDAANYLVTKVTWDNLKLNQPDFTFTAIATKSTSGGGSIRFAGTSADPVLTCASNPISKLLGTRHIGQNFTIMFWLNPDANQNNNATIIQVGWNPQAPQAGWIIRQNGTSNNNYLIKSIKQNGVANSDVPFTLTAGGWQHLAITFNETQGIKVYRNATLVATETDYGGIGAGFINYRIGSTVEFGDTTGRWTGNIAYHVAWKKVLTIEEISAIYTSQLNRYTSTPTP